MRGVSLGGLELERGLPPLDGTGQPGRALPERRRVPGGDARIREPRLEPPTRRALPGLAAPVSSSSPSPPGGPRSRSPAGRERGAASPSLRPSIGSSLGFPVPGRWQRFAGHSWVRSWLRAKVSSFPSRFFRAARLPAGMPKEQLRRSPLFPPASLPRFPAVITAWSAALKSSHLLLSRSWPCLALLIEPGTFPLGV